MWLSLLLACTADIRSPEPTSDESYTLTPEAGPLTVLSTIHCEELLGDPRCAPRIVDGVAHVALWLPKPLRGEKNPRVRALFNFESTELPTTVLPRGFEHPRGAIFLVDRSVATLVDDAMTDEVRRRAAPRPRRRATSSPPPPMRFAPLDHMINLHEEYWDAPYVWAASASEASAKPGLLGQRTILRNYKDVLNGRLRTIFIVEGFGGPADKSCRERASHITTSLGSLYSLSELLDSELHVIAVGTPFADLPQPEWEPWSPHSLPSKPAPLPTVEQLCGTHVDEPVSDLESMGVDRAGLSLLAQAGCGSYQEATTPTEMSEALLNVLDVTSRWYEVRIPLPEGKGDNFVVEVQVDDLWATVRARKTAPD